jgi:hypothetical protein
MPAWLKLAGFQAKVEWQLSQAAAVGMWFTGLPVDRTPS